VPAEAGPSASFDADQQAPKVYAPAVQAKLLRARSDAVWVTLNLWPTPTRKLIAELAIETDCRRICAAARTMRKTAA